jgi:hypothetical protein
MGRLDDLSREHISYVKKNYTEHQYAEFIRLSNTPIQDAVAVDITHDGSIRPNEIRDSIVLWTKTVKSSKIDASFDVLMESKAFDDAYSMLITAAFLLNIEPPYFQCLYRHHLPRYALRGYVDGGVDCNKLVKEIHDVLYRNKVASKTNPLSTSANKLHIDKAFCDDVFTRLKLLDKAQSFFHAKEKIERMTTVDTHGVDIVQTHGQAFANAISKHDVQGMKSMIDRYGVMIAMLPFMNKRGHKVSPMYHCFMSILAEYETDGHSLKRTEFVCADGSLLDLPVPQRDPQHLEVWRDVLTCIQTSSLLGEKTYNNFSKKYPQDNYGLFAPYARSMWCGTEEYCDLLSALVHAGGDCTLQRASKVTHSSTTAYMQEWARVQRRQRRVAWIARVLFICISPAPPPALMWSDVVVPGAEKTEGGGLLMHMLVHGQFQLAYELCSAYKVRMPDGYDPYMKIASMIKETKHRDTANGIITTLREIKPSCSAPCSKDTAKLFIDYPATLQILLADWSIHSLSEYEDLKEIIVHKRDDVLATLNDDDNPIPMESVYIKWVELNALNTILEEIFGLKALSSNLPESASEIMPFSHMAISNPLLPPFVYAC